MARAGLRGLEFYDPVTGKHGQAHMQARSVQFHIWVIPNNSLTRDEPSFVTDLESRNISSKAELLGSRKSEAWTVI